jgi:hypothetical protein
MGIQFNPTAMNQAAGHSLVDHQLQMLSLQHQQLQQTMNNIKNDLKQSELNHASPQQIEALKQNYQGIVDQLVGTFKEQLKSVGITDPAEIEGLIKELKIEAGLASAGSAATPVQKFTQALSAWEQAPGKTDVQKRFAKEILSKVDDQMSPEDLQRHLNNFFNSKTLVSNQDIFAQFPGIKPDDLSAVAGMLPGYSIKMPEGAVPTTPINLQPIAPAPAKMAPLTPGKTVEVQPITPTPPAGGLPPIGYCGSALFNYVNDSGKPDDQVFIQVIGEHPVTREQCFIKYNANGTFEYVPAKAGVNPQDFSYPLSSFPKSGEGRGVYLPVGGGMRMYSSIGNKLNFEVNAQGQIIHPDPHNSGTKDFKTPWDKVEFNVDWGTLLSDAIKQKSLKTPDDLNNLLKVDGLKKYDHKGAVFINPTAVDGFSLPMHVAATRHGGIPTQPGGKRAEQGGVTSSPEKVFADFHGDIDKIPTTGNKETDAYIKDQWRKLLIGEPPAQRLLSPMDGSQTGHFDPDFFTTSGWIDQFKNVFSKQPLLIDMNEGYPEGRAERGVWEMKVDPATNALIFTNKSGGSYSPIRLQLPAKPLTNNPARDILSGTGPGWGLNPDLNSPVRKLQDALIRNFSVAIETNTLTTSAAPGGVGQDYFAKERGKEPSAFYSNNAEMAGMGGPQFFNVYAQAVHANADAGQVYTHAYDDEGTQSGAAAFTIEEFETGTITLGKL